MFKFDRLYGNGKVYDVEYFEVGKRQFRAFCSPLDNIILSLAPRVRCNDYVVISAWSAFGDQPSYVDYEHTFRSLNRAVDFVHNMQESNLLCMQMRSDLNHGRHFEIWHIVDDDELWSGWESAVESSKISHDGDSELEFSDEDFDELADDAFPFGDCWESCIDACTPAGDVDSEKAETKSETILEKADRLKDEAQDNYVLYGEPTQSAADILDYLGISWEDYCKLTDDAQDAIRDFWRKLVVWDARYSRYCWNTLFDEETTSYLIEHYGGRIWNEDGSLRLHECWFREC